MSDDFDFEPIPGLPAHLPTGESILWQGAPRWQDLARRAYHVDTIAAYVGILVTLRLLFAVRGGQHLGPALVSFGLYLLAALAALGVLTGIAYMVSRTTVYTLTTERMVIRFGVALPITINIPLSRIESADLARRDDGTGDIFLKPTPGNRLAFLILWPHARGWHINTPQVALRCIPNVESIAQLFGQALSTSASATGAIRVRLRTDHESTAGDQLNLAMRAHLTAAE